MFSNGSKGNVIWDISWLIFCIIMTIIDFATHQYFWGGVEVLCAVAWVFILRYDLKLYKRLHGRN